MADTKIAQMAPGCIFAERFEILEKLGSGGMSTVYKARHLTIDSIVALKVMTPSLGSGSAVAKQRFHREAQAISALDHPNIVRVRAFGFEGEDGFMSMDFIDGKTLSDVLLEQGKLPVEEALKIILPAAEALSHAHAHGIVHRDIKPSNIMLSQQADGTQLVQIVDFGVATILDDADDAQKLTRTNSLIGTPYYMSPEQCEKQPVDGRSDVYSLGCVFYQLLCGHPPSEDESLFAVMYAHLHNDPKPLSDEVPGWLRAVISRAMAKEPQDRFESMVDFVSALQSRRAPHMVPSTKEHRFRWTKKAKATRTLVGALALFALCALAVPSLLSDYYFSPVQEVDPNLSCEQSLALAKQSVARWKEDRKRLPFVGRGDKNYQLAIAYWEHAEKLAHQFDNFMMLSTIEFEMSRALDEFAEPAYERSIEYAFRAADAARNAPNPLDDIRKKWMTFKMIRERVREWQARFNPPTEKWISHFSNASFGMLLIWQTIDKPDPHPVNIAREWAEAAQRANRPVDRLTALCFLLGALPTVDERAQYAKECADAIAAINVSQATQLGKLSTIQSMDPRTMLVNDVKDISNCLMDINQVEAEKGYAKARQLASSLFPDTARVADVDLGHADALLRVGKGTESIALAMSTIPVFEKYLDAAPENLDYLLHALNLKRDKLTTIPERRKLFEQMFEISKHMVNNPDEQKRVQLCIQLDLALCDFVEGKFDRGWSSAQSVLKASQPVKSGSYIATRAYNVLGTGELWHPGGKPILYFEKAYQNALKHKEKSWDLCGAAVYLADDAEKHNDFAKAIEYKRTHLETLDVLKPLPEQRKVVEDKLVDLQNKLKAQHD